MGSITYSCIEKLLISKSLLSEKYFTNKIVWWGQGLYCGGVERQIVETGKRFYEKNFEIYLLVNQIDRRSKSDFFLHIALQNFVSVDTIISKKFFDSKVASKLLSILEELDIPQDEKEIFFYVGLALANLRPRILQVWNADFFIIVLAAVVVGVPNIIVAGRSLSPDHRFPYGWESVDDSLAHKVYTALLGTGKLHFTCNSHAGCQSYETWLGLERGTVLYTPNVYSQDSREIPSEQKVTEYRRSLRIPSKARIVGGLMRFVPIKDPILWIESILTAMDTIPSLYAVLGGTGPLWNELRQALKNMGLSMRIILPGTVEDTKSFWSMVDIAMLTSHVEGLPNVLIEAQMHGKPVITTRAGGVDDIVLHDETGYIVQEREPSVIAKYIEKTLNDSKWCEKSSSKSKQHIYENFISDKAMSNIMKLYQKLL